MATKQQSTLSIACERIEGGLAISEDLIIAICNELAQDIAPEPIARPREEEALARFSASVEASCLSKSVQNTKAAGDVALGALWGIASLANALLERGSRKERELARKEALAKHRDIFELVLANPGITHGELAEGIGKTKGRLTQIMSEMSDLRLLAFHMSGRSKHYYLSERAKSLIDETLDLARPASSAPALSEKEYIDFSYVTISVGSGCMRRSDLERLRRARMRQAANRPTIEQGGYHVFAQDYSGRIPIATRALERVAANE